MTLVLVDIGNGRIVPHTQEEWARFMRGVDREAARLHDAPLVYDGTAPDFEEHVMGPGRP